MSNTADLDDGVEIRDAGGKGDGVFATRRFRLSYTVLVGRVVGRLEGNTAHATQVGRHKYVLMGGAMPKVNHSCDPNCGCGFGPSGTYSFVAPRALEPGEEITFDYAMRNWSIEHFPATASAGRACVGAGSPAGRTSPRSGRRPTTASSPPICWRWTARPGIPDERPRARPWL